MSQSSQPRKTPYASVNLTHPARDALQSASIQVSAVVGRRVSMSAALIAAIGLANAHPGKFAELINNPAPSEQAEGGSDE